MLFDLMLESRLFKAAAAFTLLLYYIEDLMNRANCVSYFYVLLEAETASETSCFFSRN
jgi:hypothetical protein